MRVCLIACCASKNVGTMPARALYRSPLFRKSVSWAELHCDRWAVLSAKHGLVGSDELIQDYERTLNTMTAAERREWAITTGEMIGERYSGAKLVVLAGVRYRVALAGHSHIIPMEGLTIGRQLSWLNAQLVNTYKEAS